MRDGDGVWRINLTNVICQSMPNASVGRILSSWDFEQKQKSTKSTNAPRLTPPRLQNSRTGLVTYDYGQQS